jgi:hypothetical protein
LRRRAHSSTFAHQGRPDAFAPVRRRNDQLFQVGEEARAVHRVVRRAPEADEGEADHQASTTPRRSRGRAVSAFDLGNEHCRVLRLEPLVEKCLRAAGCGRILKRVGSASRMQRVDLLVQATHRVVVGRSGRADDHDIAHAAAILPKMARAR